MDFLGTFPKKKKKRGRKKRQESEGADPPIGLKSEEGKACPRPCNLGHGEQGEEQGTRKIPGQG